MLDEIWKWSVTLGLDLIWPRTIWSTLHTHNSSPSFPSFSLWHKTCLIRYCAITVPSCSERCPLLPLFISVCGKRYWTVTTPQTHFPFPLLHPLRWDTVALWVCWFPTIFERFGQNKSFGAHLSATGFLLGFRNRAVPAYNRMMNPASYCRSQRPSPSLTAQDRWRSSEVLAAMTLLSQM